MMGSVLVLVIVGYFSIKDFDLSLVLSGWLGLYLLMATYAAIGLFMSTLTSYQIVAALGTLTLISFLNFIGSLWQHIEGVREEENGIRAQLHCEEKKFKQKIAYADKLGIPYVIFLGEDEISSGVVACKDMATGEQTKLEPAATVYRIKAGLAEREKGTVIQE